MDLESIMTLKTSLKDFFLCNFFSSVRSRVQVCSKVSESSCTGKFAVYFVYGSSGRVGLISKAEVSLFEASAV